MSTPSAYAASLLARRGLHASRGPESVDTMIRVLAGHDLVHRRQIDRILDHR